MTFQPLVPLGGFAGWAFLKRTRETQQAAFDGSAANVRAVEYFRENIGKVTTAEELVSDRRLLSVALGAFGLGEDIDNRFFIRKVLEDGTVDPEALGNRLSDKRYLALSKAFGFGDFPTPNTQLSTFAGDIVDRYLTQGFEVAVGTQNEQMRLGLGLERGLGELIDRDLSEDGMWYTVMAQPPLRKVFEGAFGLPAFFGTIELDQQLSVFKDRAQATFGSESVAQFADPAKREELTRLFFARTALQGGPSTAAPGSVALALLQSAGGAGLLAGL